MTVAKWKLSLLVLLAGAASACGSDKSPDSVVDPENIGTAQDPLLGGGFGWDWCGRGEPVGLSLWYENGAVRLEDGSPKTLTLYGDDERYIQELDITAAVDTTTDQGITPIIQSGDMSKLDWRGVQVVDEDWRPELATNPPTFTRSRFYRKAKWMERASIFSITPLNDRNLPVGAPILAQTGTDDKWKDSDDGFIRRFDARQITRGCRAIGDCTGATSFTAQGLMQFRNAMHAERRAQKIPYQATKLHIFWSEDPRTNRTVPIVRKRANQTPYHYGFEVDVKATNRPANNQFYVPGETIDFKVALRDGEGTLLHNPGSLPSYAAFATDQIPSGIRYYDGFQQLLTLYYAHKHREGNPIWAFSGPSDKLKLSKHIVPEMEFLGLSGTPDAITTATVAENGFSGKFDLHPTVGYMLDPVLSTQEISSTIKVKVPADAQPGTYTFAYKLRRDWSGEALNGTGVATIQVGQKRETSFMPKTGNCTNCHNGPSALGEILHRNGDRRTCYGCHQSLAFEPDHRLDVRIHVIHSRSERFPGDVNNCSTCHLTPPSGPPAGFPGVPHDL